MSPDVGTPVPAVTSTCSTSGTWFTEVPQSWRKPSADPNTRRSAGQGFAMLRYVELLEREAQLLTPDLVGSRHPDVRTLPPLPVAHDGGAEGPVAQGCPP